MNQQQNTAAISTTTNLGQLSTLTFQPNYIIQYYKNPIILNKKYNEDIIPGVYEGGFQLWQCQIQLLKKMFQCEELSSLFEGKTVCEIGCGHGLLGIGAAMLGAKEIILQDYNANVIQELTKPTVHINSLQQKSINPIISYLSGDWQQLTQHQYQNKYDIILASEVIYREQNYMKLITFIKNNMKQNGRCIMANKSYYFGVGGNVVGFRQKVEEQGLVCKSLYKIVGKSGGNKKEIIQISFANINKDETKMTM